MAFSVCDISLPRSLSILRCKVHVGRHELGSPAVSSLTPAWAGPACLSPSGLGRLSMGSLLPAAGSWAPLFSPFRLRLGACDLRSLTVIVECVLITACALFFGGFAVFLCSFLLLLDLFPSGSLCFVWAPFSLFFCVSFLGFWRVVASRSRERFSLYCRLSRADKR